MRRQRLEYGAEVEVLAPYSGVVIGCTHLPLANEGEALFHVAAFKSLSRAESKVEQFTAKISE